MRPTLLLGLFLAASVTGCMASAPTSAAAPPSPPLAASVVVAEEKPVSAQERADAFRAFAEKREAEENEKMRGDRDGDAFGEGGLGLVGTGQGGGGTGEGTIGLGSIGTIGRGAGTGTGSGHGSGAGAMGGGRSGSKGRVAAATASTSGSGLATEIIARIVRSHIAQIQYCYEKAMVKLPTLSGKVAVKFVIDAKGAVSSADGTDTTITDAEMVSCVTGVVKRMAFPAPADGSAVVVTYPFNFSPALP